MTGTMPDALENLDYLHFNYIIKNLAFLEANDMNLNIFLNNLWFISKYKQSRCSEFVCLIDCVFWFHMMCKKRQQQFWPTKTISYGSNSLKVFPKESIIENDIFVRVTHDRHRIFGTTEMKITNNLPCTDNQFQQFEGIYLLSLSMYIGTYILYTYRFLIL